MPTTNPVPSSDPTDLLFNAQKADEFMNSAALTFVDRLGNTRRTMRGIEADALSAGGAPESLVSLGLMTKLWSYRVPGAGPIYSSAIGPVTVTSGGTPYQAVVFCGWDGYAYAIKVTDGTLVWRKSVDTTTYGRCQAANVTGTSDVEIFTPGATKISCIPADGGAALWTFNNLYAREASGTATTGTGATTLKDSSKAWAANAFLRVGGSSFSASVRFTSGAASGQSKLITANAGDGITLTTEAFSPAPAAGDTYVIDPRYTSDVTFQHAGTLVNEGGTYYLYCTAFDNHVYKLRASDGALQWKFATLENIETYPLVVTVAGNLRCIVGSVDGNVRSFNAATGAVVWTASTGQVDAFLWAADVDGDGGLEVIVSGRNGRMMVLDAATGAIEFESTQAQAWNYGEVNSASMPVLLPGETYPRIISAGDNGTMWCRDRQANTLWQRPLVPYLINSSPIVHDLLGDGSRTILQGDMNGTLHAVDLATGRVIGALYVKGGIEGVPLYADIDGDGDPELVVTTTDGYVECYRFTNGAPFASAYFPGASMFAGRQT